MELKGWNRTVDDEWISTGGGFDYFITFYRNIKNPRLQIEIFQESDNNQKKIRSFSVNIGIRPEDDEDNYEFIQGNYLFVSQDLKTKREVFKQLNLMMIGNKIRFFEAWDIFPHCIIEIGATGIVDSIDEGGLWIKLDKEEPTLDEWDNKVQMGLDDRHFVDYIKVGG